MTEVFIRELIHVPASTNDSGSFYPFAIWARFADVLKFVQNGAFTSEVVIEVSAGETPGKVC